MVINIAVHRPAAADRRPVHRRVLHPGNFFSGAPGIALIFALAGYIGFEATAVFRDEARDPARTIPRATYRRAAAHRWLLRAEQLGHGQRLG